VNLSDESRRLAHVERIVTALAKELEAAVIAQQQGGHAARFEQQKAMLAEMYTQSLNYTNVIILAGYAGLFAIWQLTKGNLPRLLELLIASSLTASVTLFAGYETYKMIRNAIHLNHLARALDIVNPELRTEAWLAGLIRGHAKEARVWWYFLVPAAVTGVAAAMMLLVGFLLSLFQHVGL
jgi:hypothetical protein